MLNFTNIRWLVCLGCIACLVVGGLSRFAQAQTVAAPINESLRKELDSLIDQLGSMTYATREAAGERILKIGLSALPRIEQESQNPDLEIRYRCDQLRIKLVDLDLQARLEAFAADPKGEKEHKLEMWDRFAKWYGSTPAARQLFVEMFQAEPQLMKNMQNDSQNLEMNLTNRAMLLQYDFQAQKVRLGTVATLLFALGEEKQKLNDNAQRMVLNACYQPSMQEAMNNAEKREVLQKVLARYIVRAEGWTAQQALSITSMYNMPEGLQLARKIVKSPEQPHVLMAAFPMIAKHGNKEDIPQLEPLLEDKTIIMNMQVNNQKIQGQVRDCALVTMLHLLTKDKDQLKGTRFENGDIKAFGFDRLESNTVQGFMPHTVGFSEESKRDEVFKNWGELKKQLAAKAATNK